MVEGFQADMVTEYHLHEYLLALWGVPIGEMLDLEKLAETCREKKRWFFFFTSAPANVPGKSADLVNVLPANLVEQAVLHHMSMVKQFSRVASSKHVSQLIDVS